MNDRGLIYTLTVEPDPLWIDKMIPPERESSILNIIFEVQWPNRSVWKGTCPTSQQYEFVIKRDGFEDLVWSKDFVFLTVETPVHIPGPTSITYDVQWELLPDMFEDEGTYTLEATFIAADHKEEVDFEIQFAV